MVIKMNIIVNVDKAGRMVIPEDIRKELGITDKIILSKVNNKYYLCKYNVETDVLERLKGTEHYDFIKKYFENKSSWHYFIFIVY